MTLSDSLAQRKDRGAFFTPHPIAKFLVDWAIRTDGDNVLEPSCGDAIFLQQLASLEHHSGRVVGVELHPESAKRAKSMLQSAGSNARVIEGDFFEFNEYGGFDAVVGNPPFIRYQQFSGKSRARALEVSLRAGVPLTNLSSSWAPFVVHSAFQLKRGGRMGLVLPAELLSVNYAAGVRKFLLDHFRSIGLVLFEEQLFVDALEDVVLLLADGFDPIGKLDTRQMSLWPIEGLNQLDRLPVSREWSPPSRSAKWSTALLSSEGLSALNESVGHPSQTTLGSWGKTTLGAVTGNNRYFAMSPKRARELGLRDSDLLPLSPPGSRHLRHLTYTAGDHKSLSIIGSQTLLFRPSARLSAAAKRYIQDGERTGVDLAYKCRVRSPWWQVPYLEAPDIFLTYMNAEAMHLSTNRARVHHLNSVHGIYLHPQLRRIGRDLLPLACLNSLTLLSAETHGRAYGGGMLKVEPGEASRICVPSPEVISAASKELSNARSRVTSALASGQLVEATALVDSIILETASGIAPERIRAIQEGLISLRERRRVRGISRAR